MTDWYVEVNEGLLDITRRGADWWYKRRQIMQASGKLVDTVPGIVIGGRVEIGPFSEDDATFFAAHMIDEGGLPASAVRVKRRR